MAYARFRAKPESQPKVGRSTLERIGHELKVNPPAILAKTRRKKGNAQAERQRKAILLSKARRAGAKV